MDPDGAVRRSSSACLLASLVALGRAGWSVDDLVDEPPNPQTERDQVMAVARSFVTEFSTYGPEDLDDQNKMPAYVERVEKYLTPQVRDRASSRTSQFAEQTVAQPQVTRVGQVYADGRRTLEDDSAGCWWPAPTRSRCRTPTSADELVPSASSTFRYEVDLVHTRASGWSTTSATVDTLDGVPPRTSRRPTSAPTDGRTSPSGG